MTGDGDDGRSAGAFGRFWAGATASSFGTAISAVAIPILVVQVLDASPAEVGLVGAAQFIPYALLGLLAGAYVDRWRRQRVLVWASLGRAASLAAIPVLWMLGILHLWVLIGLLLLFGSFAVFGLAASQSLLPQLVPRSRLLAANARLDQSDAAAQTAGPLLGGGLVGLLGAPLTIALDAVSYVVEAIIVSRIRVAEPPTRREGRSLRREIAEGLRFAYGHPTLAPLGISTHVWFLANAAALTALALLALRSMGLTPAAYGLLFAISGVATLLGAAIAPWAGARFGVGRTIVAARGAYPIAWLLVTLIPVIGPDAAASVVLLFAGLAAYGFVSGLENANEMAIRQTVAPAALLGRVNATMRSANRTMGAAGALLGGIAVGLVGILPTLCGVVVLLVIAFAIAALSPLRRRRGEGDGIADED